MDKHNATEPRQHTQPKFDPSAEHEPTLPDSVILALADAGGLTNSPYSGPKFEYLNWNPDKTSKLAFPCNPQEVPYDAFEAKILTTSHALAPMPLERGWIFAKARFYPRRRRLEPCDITAVTALVVVVTNTVHETRRQSHPYSLSEIHRILPFRATAFSDFYDAAGHERFVVICPLESPVSLVEHHRLRTWVASQLPREGVYCLEPETPLHVPCCDGDAKFDEIEWRRSLGGTLLSMAAVPLAYEAPAYVEPAPPPVPSSAVLQALCGGPLGQWIRRHPKAVTPDMLAGMATNLARVLKDDESQRENCICTMDAWIRVANLGLDPEDQLKAAIGKEPSSWSELGLEPVPRHSELTPYEDAVRMVKEGEANLDRYVHDMVVNKYLVRTELERGTEISIPADALKMAFREHVPPKQLDAYIARIPRFYARAPFYHTRERLVDNRGVTMLNSYVPSDLIPVKGDWGDIRALIAHLAGSERTDEAMNFILDWLALPLQHLHRCGAPLKMLTAIVLQGVQGTGKGLLKQILQRIHGRWNIAVINQKVLDGDFNSTIRDKLLLVAEEVKSDTSRYEETREKLKAWITEPEVLIEAKGKDIVERTNHFNLLFFSNRDRPVVVEPEDRRFSVFAQEQKLADSVINAVVADLRGPARQTAAFMYELLHREAKISVRSIFESQAREEVRELSLTLEQRFARDLVRNGIDFYAQAWQAGAYPSEEARVYLVRNDDPRDPVVYVSARGLIGAFEAWAEQEGEELHHRVSGQRLAAAVKRAIRGARPLEQAIKVDRKACRVWVGIPSSADDGVPPRGAGRDAQAGDDNPDFGGT